MELLPIGTVVLLKNATKKIMVIGFLSKDAEDENSAIYDYVGCPYPEGVVSNKQYLLFNRSQINHVYHNGYIEKEELVLKNKLLEINNI